MEEIVRYANRANKLFDSVAKKMTDVELSLSNIINDETKDYVFFRLRNKIENWLKDIEEAINDITKEHGVFVRDSKSNFAFDQAKYFEATKMLDLVTEGIQKSNKMLDNSYKMFMNATYTQQHKFVLSKIEENFKVKFNAVTEISSNIIELSGRVNLLQEQINELVSRVFETEKDMDDFLEYASENFIKSDFIGTIDEKVKQMYKEINDISAKIKLPQFKSY